MKRNKRKRLLNFLVTLAMMIGLMQGMSLTAYAADDAKYREYAWNETSKTLSYEDKNIPDDAITLTAESTAWADSGWYIVPEGGITIGNRIAVTGTANLILRDGATLTASKGITVNSGNTINIYAQSEGTGVLSAGNTANAAGIGGGARYQSGGTVNIHGGIISATGGSMSAGIGGALDGGNGEVNIYSGEVTAQGQNFAAGIGGYSGKSGGTVNIYGGTVNASGKSYGTPGIGIGGTEPGSCVVHIYGGEVTATSEKAAAGIQGTVTIDGGTVTANGGVSDSISSNSGETYSSNGINGTITINGGTVTATGGNVTYQRYTLIPADKESARILWEQEQRKSVIPLDCAIQADGLPFRMTINMMLEVARAGILSKSYQEAEETLRHYYGVSINDDTLREVTNYIGKMIYMEDCRLAREAQYIVDSGKLLADEDDIEDDVLYIMTDGAALNTVHHVNKKDPNDSSWKENKLCVVFRQKDIRSWTDPKTGEKLHQIMKREYISYTLSGKKSQYTQQAFH